MRNKEVILQLSDINTAKLRLAADWVEKNVSPSQFSMRLFYDHDTDCGTVGCLLGWMVQCPDIYKNKDNTCVPQSLSGWASGWAYVAYDVFGIPSRRSSTASSSLLWDFLFSAVWANYDNTITGAVKRTRFLCDRIDNDRSNLADVLGSCSKYKGTLEIAHRIGYLEESPEAESHTI